MNYTRIPSLEHFALVRGAISLWCQRDIRDRWRGFALPLDNERRRRKTYLTGWKQIENEVKGNVARLLELFTTREATGASISQEISVFLNESLDECLTQNILGVIPPIGHEILNWKLYHEHEYLGVYVPNEFHWTSLGTIDTKKMAEALVRDENLNAIQRYKIACLYCLEEHIPNLWSNVPEYAKDYLRNKESDMEPMRELIDSWAYIASGEFHELCNNNNEGSQPECTTYSYCFKRAVLSASETATKYFFNRLTSPEKNKYLLKTAKAVVLEYGHVDRGLPSDYYADILCFLFLQMEKKQRIEYICDKNMLTVGEDNHCDILMTCLLKWPKQHYFLETLNSMRDYTSDDTYYSAWYLLRRKILKGSKDFNYRKLFGEFWRQTSSRFKSRVIQDCAENRDILLSLADSDDVENLSMLRDATALEREKIIFRRKDVCEKLVYGGKLNFFESLLKLCIPSKVSMKKFKEDFYEYIMRNRSRKRMNEEKDIWSKGFNLLNNLIQKYEYEEAQCGLRL